MVLEVRRQDLVPRLETEVGWTVREGEAAHHEVHTVGGIGLPHGLLDPRAQESRHLLPRPSARLGGGAREGVGSDSGHSARGKTVVIFRDGPHHLLRSAGLARTIEIHDSLAVALGCRQDRKVPANLLYGRAHGERREERPATSSMSPTRSFPIRRSASN